MFYICVCVHLQIHTRVNVSTQIYKHIHTHTPKSTKVLFLVNIHSVAKTNLKKKQKQTHTYMHIGGGRGAGQKMQQQHLKERKILTQFYELTIRKHTGTSRKSEWNKGHAAVVKFLSTDKDWKEASLPFQAHPFTMHFTMGFSITVASIMNSERSLPSPTVAN